MFIDFLDECIGVRECIGLSAIPHFTTLQKAAARLDTAKDSRIIYGSYKNQKDVWRERIIQKDVDAERGIDV